MSIPPLKKILFVDDDADILTIAKFSMEDIPGIECTFVTSGQAALETALKNKPDLILLDVMMPGMDGVATLQALKLLPNLSSIPVVFLTAKAQSHEINDFLKLGIIDVIIKPFDPMTFPDKIFAMWEKYQKSLT